MRDVARTRSSGFQLGDRAGSGDELQKNRNPAAGQRTGSLSTAKSKRLTGGEMDARNLTGAKTSAPGLHESLAKNHEGNYQEAGWCHIGGEFHVHRGPLRKANSVKSRVAERIVRRTQRAGCCYQKHYGRGKACPERRARTRSWYASDCRIIGGCSIGGGGLLLLREEDADDR